MLGPSLNKLWRMQVFQQEFWKNRPQGSANVPYCYRLCVCQVENGAAADYWCTDQAQQGPECCTDIWPCSQGPGGAPRGKQILGTACIRYLHRDADRDRDRRHACIPIGSEYMHMQGAPSPEHPLLSPNAFLSIHVSSYPSFSDLCGLSVTRHTGCRGSV